MAGGLLANLFGSRQGGPPPYPPPADGGGLLGHPFRDNPATMLTIAAALINNRGAFQLGDLSGLPQAVASDRASKDKRREQAAMADFLRAQGADPSIISMAASSPTLGSALAAKYAENKLFPAAPTPYTDYGKIDADLAKGLITPAEAAQAKAALSMVKPPTPYTDPAKINADLTAGLITPEQATEAYGRLGGGTFRQLIDPAERSRYGIPPNDHSMYQVGPDNKAYKVGGGDTNINLPAVGSIPPGWRVVYDENKNPVSMEPIPGGPAAADVTKADQAATQTTAAQAEKSDLVLNAIQKAREAAENGGPFAVGTLSKPALIYSDSDASKVRGWVDTLKSSTALQALLELKKSSPTGASGFGALNEKELQILIDQLGSLNPDGPQEVFMQTLDNIEQHWKNVQADIRKNLTPEQINAAGLNDFVGSPTKAPAGPKTIDGYTIQPVP